MRSLIAAAPAGTVGATLRDQVVALAIDGQLTKKKRIPISVEGLHEFPNLETLVLRACTAVLGGACLEQSSSLRRLSIDRVEPGSAVGLPSSLRALRVVGRNVPTLGDSVGWETLEELNVLGEAVPSASRIQSMASLRRLHLVPSLGDSDFTGAHAKAVSPTLEVLVLGDTMPDPEALEVLAHHPNLKTLEVGYVGDLEGLSRLGVEELWLTSWATELTVDLRPLAKMKQLRRIGVILAGDRIHHADALPHLERLYSYDPTDHLRGQVGDRWQHASEVRAFVDWYEDKPDVN